MSTASPAPAGYWVAEPIHFDTPDRTFHFLYGPFDDPDIAAEFATAVTEGSLREPASVLHTTAVIDYLNTHTTQPPTDNIVFTNTTDATLGQEYQFPTPGIPA